MATKTQKNFRKEMKKFEKQRRRRGLSQDEPLSYIYKHQSSPSTSRFTQRIYATLLMVIRVAFIVGVLSFTGIFDPMIKKMKENQNPSEIVSSKIDSFEQQKILVNYLNQYQNYTQKAHEVIDRYNNGKLDQLEIYPIQKVLMDNILFTEQVDDVYLGQLNDAVINYHQTLINWLSALVEINSEEVNQYTMSLTSHQQHIFIEIAKLFDTLNIPYQYSAENGISYNVSSQLME